MIFYHTVTNAVIPSTEQVQVCTSNPHVLRLDVLSDAEPGDRVTKAMQIEICS